MTNEHITRLEVSNFKKFDRLVVENIGQVNLITGDNNVGKTSLLEVLLLEPSAIIPFKALNYMVLSRSMNANTNIVQDVGNEQDYLKRNIVGVHQRNHKDTIKVSYVQTNKKIIEIELANELKDFNGRIQNVLRLSINYPNTVHQAEIPVITGATQHVADRHYNETMGSSFDFPILKMEDFTISHYESNKSILDRYSEIIMTGSAEAGFISILNKIFPLKINAVRIGIKELEIRTQTQDQYRPISYFGDGFIKVLKIVLLILRGNSPKVMIDEIDAGIHFSRLKSFWINILTLAKETETQLFCTTHSQDCIKAFVEAAEEMSGMKDKIRLIELEEALSEKSDRNVFASTYNFDQIQAGLNSDINLRGGKLYG